MASVLNLNGSSPSSVTGSDVIALQQQFTHHKITVRGPSGISIEFKPFGMEDYDEWADESEGVIAQNSSDVFLTGPVTDLKVTTVVPGVEVSVMVLSW